MKNILIIDDSQFMRLTIRNMLAKHQYKVIGEASNGPMGIEKYKELSPDAVTLDITMDGMNGVETLEKIMEYDSSAKVIMVSAMGQELIIRRALTAGAKGFLIKPLKEASVIDAINKLF